MPRCARGPAPQGQAFRKKGAEPVDRCALFVDASYLLADGAMAVHGTRRRDAVSWDYARLLELINKLAIERTQLPLLRCYWYEATTEDRRAEEHDALADIPGLKLRLGRVRPGRREGVDLMAYRDLTILAREHAICNAVLVSGDEDMVHAVTDAQDLGVRVTGVHVAVDGNWTISRTLRQECDDLVEIVDSQLRPHVNLLHGVDTSSPPLSNGQAPSGPISPHLQTPSTSARREREAQADHTGPQPMPSTSTGQHRRHEATSNAASGHAASTASTASRPEYAGTEEPHEPAQDPAPTPPPEPQSPQSQDPPEQQASSSSPLPPAQSPPSRRSSRSSRHRQPPEPGQPPQTPQPPQRERDLPAAGQGPGHGPSPQFGQLLEPDDASPPVQPPQQGPQPAGSPTLPEAVQAAEGEGHSFGESVARDAPALWLEAVLARKPRMPSDLEARLLQGSALPIDFLLHDEVRQALRGGFWEALENSRRS